MFLLGHLLSKPRADCQTHWDQSSAPSTYLTHSGLTNVYQVSIVVTMLRWRCDRVSTSNFSRAVWAISFTVVGVGQVSDSYSSSCELSFVVKLLSYFYQKWTACLRVPSFESFRLLASTSCCRRATHSYWRSFRSWFGHWLSRWNLAWTQSTMSLRYRLMHCLSYLLSHLSFVMRFR